MKTILITGGTTFVSRYTAEHFVKKGDTVYVINRGSREQVKGVRHINRDRTRLDDNLKRIHFDAVLDICAYTQEHVQTLVNSLGSFNDYVFISSSAVYPETSPQPFREDMPCGKNAVWGDYGTNKLAAEEYLRRHVPNAYILRPPYLYGIYENLYREPFVFDCALKGREFFLPQNGKMKLQFFNVSDLCRFIDILLEQHPGQKIFNVGNREPVTIREWVTLCYQAAGKTPEFVRVEKSVCQRDYFPFYDYEYLLDVSRQTAFMPDTRPLAVGLEKEFEWYQKNDPQINRKPYFDFIDIHLS